MPDPTLAATALRYAANDLPPADAAAFEARLAAEQEAREALAEAVRLSAAALGVDAPAPDSSFRALIRDRLRPLAAWMPRWLARRAYRGHPLAWAALGAVVIGGATLAGLRLADPPAITAPTPPSTAALPEPATPMRSVVASAPEQHAQTEAEIWAELSTPDHVEKDHHDELKWRHRMRDLHVLHPARPSPTDRR